MSCLCKSQNTKNQVTASAGNLQLQARSSYIVYIRALFSSDVHFPPTIHFYIRCVFPIYTSDSKEFLGDNVHHI